jgi:hypothetical protein
MKSKLFDENCKLYYGLFIAAFRLAQYIQFTYALKYTAQKNHIPIAYVS